MFGFVISLVVQIWMAIIQKALTRPVEPKAGKVDLPRAEEGDAIPAVFGTVLIAPNMIWWGNVEPKPIKGDRRISAFGVDIQGRVRRSATDTTSACKARSVGGQ